MISADAWGVAADQKDKCKIPMSCHEIIDINSCVITPIYAISITLEL